MPRDSFPVTIILGAARSGTTLLGEHLLDHHREIAYWGEPNHVWNYRNLYGSDDVREASEATPEVKDYVRETFREYLDDRPGRIFVEKTPGNCLRIPFIREVFPEARFLHLVRDGRDVAMSARLEWQGGKGVATDEDATVIDRLVDWAEMIVEQIRLRNAFRTVRLHQIPHYVWRAFELARMRIRNETSVWGTKIPDLGQIREEHTLLETCGIQWRESVESVRRHWETIPEARRLQFRYEDLLDAPEATLQEILAFMELSMDEALADQLSQIRSGNQRKWERLPDSELAALEAQIGETLDTFGYPRGA